MKKRNIVSVFTLVFVILGLFAACDIFDSIFNKPDADSEKPGSDQPDSSNPGSNQPDSTNPDSVSSYTVNFNANGGTPVPKSQTITRGEKVAMPTVITRNGYTFGGWFKEAACTNQWNFATDTVRDNITLYAKWNSIGSFTCTVTFNANGGSPAPDPQSINNGEKVSMPTPSKTGYIFGGWYKEVACTNQWDFAADSVSGNIILYAQWYSPTPVSGNTLAEKLQWISNNASSNSGYLLEVLNDENLAPKNLTYTGKSNITIQLKGIGNPRNIILLSNGSLFIIGNGVTLILEEDLILVGKTNNSSSLVNVQGGALIMNQGVKITTNSASSDGGGVCVFSGTFTMNGGEISGNRLSSSSRTGGGVLANGTFTMNGGKISGNSASNGGGVSGRGTFIMNGGEISGNSAGSGEYDSHGGGVRIQEGGTFIMNGGEISGNSISSSRRSPYGGGVYIIGGTFTMNNGQIFGNKASSSYSSSYGGGVFVSGTFTMNNGQIFGNKADTSSSSSPSSYGGGVYVLGTFTKSVGGTITGYEDILHGNILEKGVGRAVYVTDSGYNSGKMMYKDTTTGPMDHLYFNGNVNPPVWSGAWDN